MALEYQLEPLGEQEATRWDSLIAPHKSCELFHRKVWLDYLAASQAAEIRLWAIRAGGETVGYFCGGIIRRGPFKILGSPLRGWNTNFMGPVANDDLDQVKFLAALDRLAHQDGIAMVELEQRLLSDSALTAAGYRHDTRWTYWVDLTPGDEQVLLERLHKSRRYGIRKAIKSGLVVEETRDPAIVDEYYDQFSTLMSRKGSAAPYPREYPRLLFHYLTKENHLLALRVKDRRGRVLATGLFPYDNHTVYYWGGASLQEGRELCPNDLLHWTVMCAAAKRGIRRYDLSGWGRFKREFGGELITVRRWHKPYWRTARWARRGYEIYFKNRIRLRSFTDGIMRHNQAKA